MEQETPRTIGNVGSAGDDALATKRSEELYGILGEPRGFPIKDAVESWVAMGIERMASQSHADILGIFLGRAREVENYNSRPGSILLRIAI